MSDLLTPAKRLREYSDLVGIKTQHDQDIRAVLDALSASETARVAAEEALVDERAMYKQDFVAMRKLLASAEADRDRAVKDRDAEIAKLKAEVAEAKAFVDFTRLHICNAKGHTFIRDTSQTECPYCERDRLEKQLEKQREATKTTL